KVPPLKTRRHSAGGAPRLVNAQVVPGAHASGPAFVPDVSVGLEGDDVDLARRPGDAIGSRGEGAAAPVLPGGELPGRAAVRRGVVPEVVVAAAHGVDVESGGAPRGDARGVRETGAAGEARKLDKGAPGGRAGGELDGPELIAGAAGDDPDVAAARGGVGETEEAAAEVGPGAPGRSVVVATPERDVGAGGEDPEEVRARRRGADPLREGHSRAKRSRRVGPQEAASNREVKTPLPPSAEVQDPQEVPFQLRT